MTEAQRLARSKGGLARARKHAHEQLVAWAKLGGRPRRQPIIWLQSAPEAKINLKEVNAVAALSIPKLRGLVKELYPEWFPSSPGRKAGAP